MKKWPFIVAGLYGLALLVLFGPLLLVAFPPDVFIPTLHSALREWIWLVPIGTMGLAQLALLRVPVSLATRRPVTQRALLTTIITAAFMMGLLAFGAVISLYEFVRADKSLNDANVPLWLSMAAGLASWACWAFYFHRSAKAASLEPTVARIGHVLWKGSILELLVAVPTHIVARHRDYCCAGALTFIGLTCGLSVMVFAFGPAVYFLFIERWKRLHPNQEAP